jgi:chaperone modulatory protein CbpM
MISEKELCAMIDRLEAQMLRQWVDAGLVRSAGTAHAMHFEDADVARVRLICELHYDLAVEEETLPLVLSLMDQIYDLRRSSRAIAAAIASEDEEVKRRIAVAAVRWLGS